MSVNFGSCSASSGFSFSLFLLRPGCEPQLDDDPFGFLLSSPWESVRCCGFEGVVSMRMPTNTCMGLRHGTCLMASRMFLLIAFLNISSELVPSKCAAHARMLPLSKT